MRSRSDRKPPQDGPFGTTFAFIGPEGYAITTHGA
jgi:hypothetical protein